jgi:two-component system, OmpR family, response regulator
LDIGLPLLDGISVLKKWRNEGISTPVLVLSARGSWAERVDGIDSGADDYLPKPFQVQELVSRLRALMRRTSGHAQSNIVAGPLEIDMRSRVVTVLGKLVNLTPLEFRLVHFLVLKGGEVVGQSELCDAIYDHNHERDANAIEAVVSRLRKKLGHNIIQNKRGFGYFILAAQN